MTDERKTGDNLYKYLKDAIEFVIELGIYLVGLAGDAGPDEKKARRLARNDFPWLLLADCWAHQIALVLGDFFKDNPEIKKLLKETVEASKWFPNHSYSYGLFLKEQASQNNGRTLALILPVVSRWTVYAATLERLLKVRKPLTSTVVTNYDEIWASIDTSKRSKEKKAKRALKCPRSRVVD
jgi:hypothetical protein